MISLFKYVEHYGRLSFKEEKFNDVDNVIFSLLSYIDFSEIVPKEGKKISLGDASKIFFSKYSKKELDNNIFSIRSAIKLFHYIKDFERYKDLMLYNYVHLENSNEQFSALCIKIYDGLIYISFEGTDELVSGWKEDLELSYMFPIPSQVDAINYINKTVKFKDKRVIVGGHSKGGNLAIIGAMYCNFWIRNRIIKVYSNDGPGMLEKQLNSNRLKKLKSKYIHIVPEYSIVGMLLDNCNDEVIKSRYKGIFAHDALNWEVEDNHFVTGKLNNNSKELRIIMKKWLKEYDFVKRKNCVLELFNLLSNHNINSLLDIKKNSIPLIVKIIIDSKNLNDTSKEMFKKLIILFYDDYSTKLKQKIGLI